ncbi:MAG: aminotransferase class I/II-fold pyridoxal phosphate-dependent enzyme [Candidatus Micrarchaeia archaeon]
MAFEYSERVRRLPPYLFAEIERAVAEKKAAGADIINLGIGDPDLPPPSFLLRALAREAKEPKNHNYSLSQGEPAFREACARWMKKRFGVEVDPQREVIGLIGSKEGLANLARAFVNPGDSVLVPEPAYPVYSQGAALLSDGRPVAFPLLEEHDFQARVEHLPPRGARMLYLNYPNNPTGAVATRDTLEGIVDYCEETRTILCYDNAYCELTFDDYRAPSILEFTRNAIEFHSLSKTFCMTGDRIGFAVGNAELIEGLRRIKSQIDSGPPVYIQKMAIAALDSYTGSTRPPEVERRVREFARRRKILVRGLNKIGLRTNLPLATFYIWTRVPGGNSVEFAKRALQANVVVTPGVGFGRAGEGYVRFALTQPGERIKEAIERLAGVI